MKYNLSQNIIKKKEYIFRKKENIKLYLKSFYIKLISKNEQKEENNILKKIYYLPLNLLYFYY